MGALYYGATTAVAFLAGATHIAALDAGTTNYAGYVSFDAAGRALRVLVVNSDYYEAGSGTRGKEVFTLTGLVDITAKGVVRAKRLTAGGALSRVDRGDDVTFGGQWFGNGTCVVGGTEVFESVKVEGGKATFEVKATEALLVYLQE